MNQNNNDQEIDMEADSWHQIYLTGKDMLKVCTAIAVWAALCGYLAGKLFN